MRWVKQTEQYKNGWDLYVGQYVVGSVGWNGCAPKNDPKVWVAYCRLPGIKGTLGSFEHVEDAQVRIEGIVRAWFQDTTKDLDDPCPTCGRKKAHNVREILNGYCPKWYAIRDQAAEDDCTNHKRTP